MKENKKMTYERNFHLLNNKFRELFFPTLIAAVASNFAVIADALIISIFLGARYLSVIQSIEPFAQIINMVYWIIAFGGTIIATTLRADFEADRANEIFTISVIVIIIVSSLIALSGVLFPDIYMNVLCNSAQLRPLVYEYFELYIIGVPFMSLMVVLAYFMKTDDFIQLQFRAFILVNVLNVILDVLLLKVYNLGIKGIALTTTLGFIIGTIYISYYFLSDRRTFKLVKVNITQSLGQLINICKTGFSSSSIALYQSIKLILINSLLVGTLGNVGLVAYNTCFNTSFIVTVFILGTAQSILPIVAIYFQEDDQNGVAYVSDISLKIVIGFGIFFTIFFFVFPQSILYLFSVTDAADIPVITNAVRIFSLSFIAYSISYLYIFYAQAVQYTKLANIITFLNGLVLPVGCAYVFSHFWQENGIWFALVASEILTVVFIYLYSMYVTKKSGGEYYGFFLNKKAENVRIVEHTIKANMEEAVGVAKKIEKELPESDVSREVGLAVEKLIVHIIEMNDKLDWIDIIIRDRKDSTDISIKNGGLGFHREEEYEDLISDYYNLKEITDNIEYSQILGLNNTVLTLRK